MTRIEDTPAFHVAAISLGGSDAKLTGTFTNLRGVREGGSYLCDENESLIGDWGRDYADISPIRGVILGGGNHSLTVSVDVTRVGTSD